MIFLEKDDLVAQIKDQILLRIIEESNPILFDAERKSLSEMQAYLRTDYNLQAIFSQTGIERNHLLVMLLVDMTLYHLHSRLNTTQFPEIRKERYIEAKRMLEDIRDGKIDVGLARNPKDKEESTFEYGSQPRRYNRALERTNVKDLTDRQSNIFRKEDML